MPSEVQLFIPTLWKTEGRLEQDPRKLKMKASSGASFRGRKGSACVKIDEEVSGFNDEYWDRRSHQSYTDPSCHHLISSFVVPTFNFLCILCASPSKYYYDAQTDSFRSRKGSWLRKGIGLVLLLVTTVQSIALSRLREMQVHHSLVLVMWKIHTLTYVTLGPVCFAVLVRKQEQICQVLDRLYAAIKGNLQKGTNLPSKLKVRLMAVLMIVLGSLATLAYALGHAAGYSEAPVQDFEHYTNQVANTHVRAVLLLFTNYGNVSQFEEYKLEHLHSQPVVITLGTIGLLLDWWGGILRVSIYILITQWGMLFWMLLHHYFRRFDARSATESILLDLRTFNEITSILDSFNDTFGAVILAAVVTGVVHFSIHLIQLFLPTSNVVGKVAGMILFFGFFGQLISSAQVHSLASSIVRRVKSQYQDEPAWHQHDASIETAQGIMFIMHEVETNSIGLQGLGFFTCSYSLIGTVFSVISTYAVIVVQFQG